ncbi:amino acid adenylation domain-containing protein [Sphaerothrix gracilis]|uniref:amino acid adenylation domain-containing protein n=1 Tax=Sphaerothrix gracilis TaxID=3151835 RepID=UPI0031FD83CC
MSTQTAKNVESIYPLSPMQQGMLFHTLLAPESGAYFEQISCTLSGDFNPAAFRQAWQRVVERHPILRTLFLWEGRKQPLQIVRKSVSLPWMTADWRSQPPSDHPALLEQFLQTDREQGFELHQAPLMRLALIQIAAAKYYFVWSYHHLLLDGWCKPLILNEMLTYYEALTQGKDRQLPPAPPYRRYITWLQKQDLAQAKAFWQHSLQGLTQPTPLPIRPARPNLTGEPRQQQIQLAAASTQTLRNFAQQYRLTLNTLVQAAWGLLLSRYSGETDVVFGATVSGRSPHLADSESIVGPLINTLPARLQISPEANLLTWLQTIQSRQVEREQYAYTPLADIQKWSEMPQGCPLFDSILVFENYPIDQSLQQRHGHIQISHLSGFERTNYPLTVVVMPTQRLSIQIHYDSQQFEAASVERLLKHLANLLTAIAANAQQKLSDISLLEAAEQQLMAAWNNTQAEYPREKCLHQLFEAQVNQTPEAPAVTFQGRSLTYGQLNRKANQLARYLQKLGVKPEVLVGVCVERSWEMLVGLLGVLKAGGAYIPLDPSYPPERLAFMLADSQAAVLLTQKQLRPKLPAHAAQVVYLDADWDKVGREDARNPASDVHPQNLAYVIYTSGSTGKPKGTMIVHRGLVNYLSWCTQAYAVAAGGGTLVHSSISFDATITSLFAPLLVGQKVVLLPEENEIEALGEALRSHRNFSLIKITPAHLELLNQLLPVDQLAGQTKAIVLGGEALLGSSLSSWQAHAPETRIINEYGPTETVVGCCVYEVKAETALAEAVPIGRPIANTQLYILDKQLRPVPIGLAGELYIGGDGLARGYLHRPDLTEAKFIPHPLSHRPDARLYKTGDLARYRPDGNIEFLGRIDHQVKIRGFRVELGEIEAVLNLSEQVQQCVVVAAEITPSDRRLVAYVVRDRPIDIRALKAHLKQQLPDYMIPAIFMQLERLPLTVNGKVDRRALPAPDLSQRDLAIGFVAPRTPTEELVASIWTELLGCEVGIYDNFFDLGGHSLLATQVVSRLRQTFALDLPLRSLFDSLTVAQLSQLIDTQRQSAQGLPFTAIAPVAREGNLPLSFAQQRLWFLDQLEESRGNYHLSAALRLRGALNLEALEQAIAAIVARHEILRTTFPSQDGQAVQHIAPSWNESLRRVDLRSLSEVAQSTEVQRQIAAAARQPFDLATGPLLRASLLQLSPDTYILLATMHHIIADGWSMGLLINELATLYRAFAQAQPSPLPPLPIQYADFAHWQRQSLQGQRLEQQLAYWRQQLAGLPALLPLPTDKPRPPLQSFHGARSHFCLDADLTAQLKQLAQRCGATLFMALVAALSVLLARYSGQKDIAIGSPIANRNRPELEPLIGFFVNTLVLRSRLEDNPSFEALLSQVRQSALAAYAHQDLPFEKLVEELRPERSLSHSPLFQVMLVLQNTPPAALTLPELELTPIADEQSSAAKFDLTLFVTETAAGLSGMWRYSTDLFEAATIARLSGHFQQLLRSIVASPQQRVEQLPLLPAAERQLLLQGWNQNQHPFPAASLPELLEAQVEKTPETLAVVYGAESLTYAELNQRANQLAHFLQQLGVGPESRVALCLERSLELLIGLWGILKAGGAYVPLDPGQPAQRLASLLADAEASVLVSQQAVSDRLALALPSLPRLCLDADWPQLCQQPRENPARTLQPSNLAYVIYTSGSTGQPKGVAIEHRSIVNYTGAILKRLQPESGLRWGLVSSIAADMGYTILFPALCSGGCVHVLSAEQISDPAAYSDYLEAQAIDLLKITPSHLAALQCQSQGQDQGQRGLPRRQLILGGEAASGVWLRQLQARAPGCQIVNHYGPTEATVGVLSYQMPLAETGWQGEQLPLGRPLANCRVYILDDQQQPVPIGVAGELYIGGACLARGYLQRPELNQAKFTADPFSDEPGARLYRSGDRGRYLADGNIEFLGRMDRQVKVRGFRIELGEVEAAMAEHPRLQQGVVVAVADQQGGQRLVAYGVAAEGGVSSRELRRFLRERLPEYMVPSVFVPLAALPLLPNGKLDRRALPPADAAALNSETVFVAPRNQTEILLADILIEVLGLQRVGVHDSFFDLGGHSLHATQAISRIRAAFAVELPLRSLFEHPTIAELAEALVSIQLEQADQGLIEQIFAEVDALSEPEAQTQVV